MDQKVDLVDKEKCLITLELTKDKIMLEIAKMIINNTM